ncbi:unnamed protein product [Nippostrongylus brasiliensis]|uniref:Failed axon connections (inferred by orthology to a D. melanogaster protein) n=1 Tax=Nippostrongylus brasiliensis TaxID=27835 RepID=A0A0N4YLS5_NIPBR|nr:unnamed protein product [Nippostrongylus brasiliensis]
MVCLLCVAVISALSAVFFFFRRAKKEVKIQKEDWKRDFVYLYQFPRSKTVPSLSPYCLKVETFLKAHNIPYEVVTTTMGRSKYGLLPFVELNGEHIADSQIILDRLSQHFNVKLWCIQLAYEISSKFSSLSKRIKASIGDFSVEDCKDLLKKDYDAYRDLLGDGKFLFGDEITVADCTLFSHLATTIYLPVENYAKDLLKEQYPSLIAFCERVKEATFGGEFEQE